jgi:hypothetical protein
MRLISTRTVGEAGWPPAKRLLIEAGEALVEEATAPLADNLSPRIQARRDDIVGQPLRTPASRAGRLDDFDLLNQVF